MADFALDHVQIGIQAGREAEARAFYGTLIGLTEIAQPPVLAARGGAWYAIGPLQLHLAPQAEHGTAPAFHPALRCPDFAAMRARLEAAGGELSPVFRFAGRSAFLATDPFGNTVELQDANADVAA